MTFFKRSGHKNFKIIEAFCLVVMVVMIDVQLACSQTISPQKMDNGLQNSVIEERPDLSTAMIDTGDREFYERPKGLLVVWPGNEELTLLIADLQNNVLHIGSIEGIQLRLMPPGRYIARVNKPGYQSRYAYFDISKKSRSDLHFTLLENGVSDSFVYKNRYWLMGAMLASAATTASLIQAGGSEQSAGLPSPPGRP